MGYHPDIAENGKIVLEMVGHEQYDLILMDVQMPEMDGISISVMTRLNETCVNISRACFPLVAITGNSFHCSSWFLSILAADMLLSTINIC
jgi:CheY-like chemotaxis protein